MQSIGSLATEIKDLQPECKEHELSHSRRKREAAACERLERQQPFESAEVLEDLIDATVANGGMAMAWWHGGMVGSTIPRHHHQRIE